MPRHLSREEIVARKEKRLQAGEANMARYLEQQQKTLDKTARLRALRLAQDAPKPAKRPSLTKDTERRPLPGLHQGVRE
jgi:hypothetical protein